MNRTKTEELPMTPATLRDLYIQELKGSLPALEVEQITPLISDNLLSPFVVTLPSVARQQAQNFAETLYRLRQNTNYQKNYQATYPLTTAPSNNSILMSYDFHWDGQDLKLIEVNTNAAFLALGWFMNKAHGLPSPIVEFQIAKIKADIENEIKLNRGQLPAQIKIAIVDHKPEAQRLFVEFLVYKELFQSWGWSCEILDVENATNLSEFDFIYNRHTDFYLQEDVSQKLRETFLTQKNTISPQPLEYHLLATKERMEDWTRSELLDQWGVSPADQAILKKHVPKTFAVANHTADEIWTQRKQLFFKPKSAFGSKQSYKGESISRRIFGDIMAGNFIAQELVPPSEIEGKTDLGLQKFKYDLRFYAYQNQIEFVVARLYQGQVTNLKSPWGGFAAVQFTD